MSATAKRTPPESIPVIGLVPDYPDPKYVKICCPKCRSRNLVLTELWEHTIQWSVTDGWMDKAGGSLEPVGPTGVEAKCAGCGHWWTARNAAEIMDVLEEN